MLLALQKNAVASFIGEDSSTSVLQFDVKRGFAPVGRRVALRRARGGDELQG